ncbi:MAG: MarR family winged helix-turn-helix transcriptional regulator [Halocynthiibacter sp.]
MSDFILDEFLPYQLAVAASRISRAYARIYQQKFGITIPEWRVVAHLSQAGAVSVREIHARVDMDKSKVSRAAGRLEAAGYVTKRVNDIDRRLVELALTDRGLEMIKQLTPIAKRFEADILAQLGERSGEFQATLVQLIEVTKAGYDQA